MRVRLSTSPQIGFCSSQKSSLATNTDMSVLSCKNGGQASRHQLASIVHAKLHEEGTASRLLLLPAIASHAMPSKQQARVRSGCRQLLSGKQTRQARTPSLLTGRGVKRSGQTSSLVVQQLQRSLLVPKELGEVALGQSRRKALPCYERFACLAVRWGCGTCTNTPSA